MPHTDLLRVVQPIDLRVLATINEVKRWYPDLLYFDDHIPESGNDVQNQSQNKNDKENLSRLKGLVLIVGTYRFGLLILITLVDKTRQSKDTNDLENTQELKQYHLHLVSIEDLTYI